MFKNFMQAVLVSIFAIVGVLVVLAFLGAMVEGLGDWQAERDRCLKHATNGYEIRRCR